MSKNYTINNIKKSKEKRMDIKIFVRRRKEMGLSQIELSNGICTQATLSRFENHGQIPSVKILSQLCARLQLDVGDLFACVNTQEVAANKLLEKLEESIVIMDYKLAEKLVLGLEKENLTSNQQLHLLYLKAYTQTLQGKATGDDLFYFNRLLAEQQEKNERYLHLAYAGLGLVYQQKKDHEKAIYFFEKAIQEIEQHKIEKMGDVWRVLLVLYYSSLFFADEQDYEKSDDLLKKGITLCSQYHITYYLGHIYFRLAINAKNTGASDEKIVQFLNDAAAFARINSKDHLLKEIQKVKEEMVNS